MSTNTLSSIKSAFCLLKRKLKYRLYQRVSTLFPAGHFYSPVVDPVDIKLRDAQIWHGHDEMPGINWDVQSQRELLNNVFKNYAAGINYPIRQEANEVGYYYENDQFPVLDAEVLYCMLCHFKPKRMIEIGST